MPATWSEMSISAEDVVHYPSLTALLSRSVCEGEPAPDDAPSHALGEAAFPAASEFTDADTCTVDTDRPEPPVFGNRVPLNHEKINALDICASILRHQVLHWRYDIIKLLNAELVNCLELIDLQQLNRLPTVPTVTIKSKRSSHYSRSRRSLPELLSLCRNYIFSWLKDPIILKSVQSSATEQSSSKFEMVISRSKAVKHAAAGECDVDGRWSVFGQVFRRVHGMNASVLRRSGQLWDTVFAGERYRSYFGTTITYLTSSLHIELKTPADLTEKSGLRCAQSSCLRRCLCSRPVRTSKYVILMVISAIRRVMGCYAVVGQFRPQSRNVCAESGLRSH
jgi:hypothetical protein